MKKFTFLLLTVVLCSFNGFAQTVLNDFSGDVVGTSYPIYGMYQNAVSTTRGTATVAADPAGTYGNSLKVVPTSGNHMVLFSIVIPTGTTLADYSTFYFDLYPCNYQADGVTSGTGARYSTALVQVGSSCTPGATGATALLYETSTVDKGSSNTWHTISISLTSLSGLSAYSGTTNLFIGLYSNSNTVYYLDNIKIPASTSGVSENVASPIVVYSSGNSFLMNQTVDKAEVFDMKGSKVASVSNSDQIATSSLANGVYIVKMIIGSTNYVTKIIK